MRASVVSWTRGCTKSHTSRTPPAWGRTWLLDVVGVLHGFVGCIESWGVGVGECEPSVQRQVRKWGVLYGAFVLELGFVRERSSRCGADNAHLRYSLRLGWHEFGVDPGCLGRFMWFRLVIRILGEAVCWHVNAVFEVQGFVCRVLVCGRLTFILLGLRSFGLFVFDLACIAVLIQWAHLRFSYLPRFGFGPSCSDGCCFKWLLHASGIFWNWDYIFLAVKHRGLYQYNF